MVIQITPHWGNIPVLIPLLAGWLLPSHKVPWLQPRTGWTIDVSRFPLRVRVDQAEPAILGIATVSVS